MKMFVYHLFFKEDPVTMATNLSSEELGWEWEGDKQAWTAFSAEHNDAINDARCGGKTSVKLTANNVQIEVKLDKMVQRNCKTGWERRIRGAVKADEDCKCISSRELF